MSEYQYYEFRAVDRPLGERDVAALRAITSRAEITPTSLTNVYHWGDFKGDPDRLMDRYFEAHLYLANWGTRRLMFRLPARSFPLPIAKPYAVPNVLKVRASGEAHVVLDFHFDSEGDDDFEEGEGWLASLIGLRSDLLAGDLRCLYLGWLGGVQAGEVKPGAAEPAVPPGLGRLSASLKRFAEFLRIDADLIEVAAAASGESAPTGPSAEGLAAWVAGLPAVEKDRLLVRVVQGEGVPLAGELLRRFRTDGGRVERGGAASSARRTAGELLAARDRLAAEKRRRAAERTGRERERRVREASATRARHLDALAGREEDLWRQVEEAIGTRQAKGYDRAVELLRDLRDLADRSGAVQDLARRVAELRLLHRTRPALLARLERAGLPK